ncbi:MAG: hypothetical protein OHK0029_08010 [Armatimonadaceae bacterium]
MEWTRREFATGLALGLIGWQRNTAWGAEKESGMYVAVGYGGRRIASPDGIHWKHRTDWAENGKDDDKNLMSATFGKGKFVVVGGGGWTRETQAGHILVSTDGITWRQVQKFPNRVNPVLFGGGRFIAGGPDKALLFSEDAETWSAGGKIPFDGWAFWFREGAYGNDRFVYVGNCEKDQKTHWSAVTGDGKTVESFVQDLPPVRGIAYGADCFVAVGPEGRCVRSTDGITWKVQHEEPDVNLGNIVWTGSAFFATGSGKGYLSADGKSWKKVEQRIPCNVLYADASVFIGTTWPGQMWTSPDGQRWEKCDAMPPNGINQVVYGKVSV